MATSVLIVNYLTYDELARCLESLGPFLGTADEVVIVDFESRRSILDAIAAAHPRIIAIPREDNRGFAAGVNLAASATRAPYLLLLNPDTVVQGPVIQILEEWLSSHPETGAAGARVLNDDGTVQPTARRFPDLTTLFGGRSTRLTARSPDNWFSRRNLLGIAARDPLSVDWVSGACLMTRRDLFDRVGGFDESFFLYWEDADYCRRIAQLGFNSMYIPQAAVRHTGGRAASRRQIESIRAFHRSAFRMYWKYASTPGRIVAPLVRAGLWLRGERRVRQARRAQK